VELLAVLLFQEVRGVIEEERLLARFSGDENDRIVVIDLLEVLVDVTDGSCMYTLSRVFHKGRPFVNAASFNEILISGHWLGCLIICLFDVAMMGGE
jgi:hypothetical protein